ncbi:hypothetical protein LCGC14_1389790 [marine sediment metagenome]|uniref:Uncharacterized protein n=1 Tax=marine sediment metagenome TaxID=412755 RepID=A0A0F9MFW3_9ZZZZ
MIDLKKYIVGIKRNNTDNIEITRPERIKKQTENCWVLLIPVSEWEQKLKKEME